MNLYPLVQTKDGRVKGEFPVGTLNWDGENVTFRVGDRATRDKLEKLFRSPLRIRCPLGDHETALGHYWKEIAPGSDEHFLECARRLHQLHLKLEFED